MTGANSIKDSTWEELKKICYIAMPMVVVTVSQKLLLAASMSIVGHLGELELTSTALATSLANVSGFSVLFGLSLGLETLCGQAYGAGQHKKLGTYACSGITSLLLVCLPVSLLWIFIDKLLILIGQDPSISAEARKYTIWLIPSLFPYAILQVLNRYLLSQSLILPMLFSSVAVLLFHVPICWGLVFGLDMGIAGAALAIGLSYTLNDIFLGVYVTYSAACQNSRISFSKDNLKSIREFFRFGVPAAVMLCLEWWCFEIVILVSGLLRNPKLETSVLSISLTIASLHYFIPYSFGAAASTRISNELGAGNPEAARKTVWLVLVIGIGEALIACVILFSCRSGIGYAFGNAKEVAEYVEEMTPLISLSLIVDAGSALLSGVARGSGWQHIGAGWQHIGAYINLGAYYLAGIPVALVLGFVLHLRVKGLWIGTAVGATVQCILLALVTYFTNWQKQATQARERIFEVRSDPEKYVIP